MKRFIQMNRMFILIGMATAVFLTACNSGEPAAVTPLGGEAPPSKPTATAIMIEVPVEIGTPEPTPTIAVCKPMPEDLHITIRRKEDLQGVIEVTGLQPGERPILLLTGQGKVTWDRWRRETQYENAVEADGRMSYRFDFKGWPSIEEYKFKGQFIHERGVACFDIELPLAEETDVESRGYVPVEQPILPLTDYPPAKSPYYIEDGDLWLVHTLDEKLYAFLPIAPTYADNIEVDECRYTWSEPQRRFIDPCSGDEWELNGALNLKHSTELWSNRDLDQYGLSIEEGRIFVHLNNVVEGLSLDQPPLAQDNQYGVTVTAVTTKFTPETTIIDTMVQVDPIWQMNPNAFPPQQALSYPTLLIDDQGGSIAGEGREGGTAVYNPSSGGLQQMMFNRWETVSPDATVVTTTLTVDLSNLNHKVILPLEWESHQVGDTWAVNLPLGIGYTNVRVRQIEWLATADNGLARLRLTISDESLDDLRLNCLDVGTAVPSTPACATFDNEQTYAILTQPGEPVTLHLRVGVALLRPFQLRLDVAKHE